ncbi:hypothetical protein HZB03_03150 [Candidatus Woesearchaeota archaeon]|nr:hypothetical protein [Candidatus Woesearchaeota archaeon]
MRLYQRITAGGLVVTGSLGLFGCKQRDDAAPNDRRVVYADVNKDGIQDLLYATMTEENQDKDNDYYDWDLFLALGYSDGRFSESKKIATVGMPPNDLQAKDLNGDSNPDISYLVMKPGVTGKDGIYYDWGLMVMDGNGDGTFKSPREAYNFDKSPGAN